MGTVAVKMHPPPWIVPNVQLIEARRIQREVVSRSTMQLNLAIGRISVIVGTASSEPKKKDQTIAVARKRNVSLCTHSVADSHHEARVSTDDHKA